MAKTAQSAPEIARKGAYVGAFAAFGFKHGVVPIRNVNELQATDFDGPRCQFHVLAISGQIVRPLAFDLDCRIARGHLLYKSCVRGQESANSFRQGSLVAYGNGTPFGVVGIALLTPLYGETI